jgi:hypothetical protein
VFAVPSDDHLVEVMVAALEADTRLEVADSLYDADATVVADGNVRHVPPRFAGIGLGGIVGVMSSRTEVRTGLAWVEVSYRWISTAQGMAREGRATLVLVPGPRGAWRIRHAHSSSPQDEGLPLMLSRILSAVEGEKSRRSM